jgi:hypothetical protein
MKTFVTLGGSVGGSVSEMPSTPVGPDSRAVVDPDNCVEELELEDCVPKIEVVSVTVTLVMILVVLVLVCTNMTPTISAIMAIAPITPAVKIFRPEFILIDNTVPYMERM